MYSWASARSLTSHLQQKLPGGSLTDLSVVVFPLLFYSANTIILQMNEIVTWSELVISQKMQIKHHVLHRIYSLCLHVTPLLCLAAPLTQRE